MKLSLPYEMPSDNLLPPLVHGYVSVKGQRSVFTDQLKEVPDSTALFQGKEADRDDTRKALENAGFVITAESQLGFAVTAAAGAYEDLTGGLVEPKERLMFADEGCIRYVTHLDIVGEDQPKVLGAARIKSKTLNVDGLFLERPRVIQAVFPSPVPPVAQRFYLRVPDDVGYVFGAHLAHQWGVRGDGVQIAMPDTGQYQHPFFVAHQYAVKRAITVVPDTDPANDPVGHGTGESANIFALAPGVVLQPIRVSNDSGDLVAAVGGFMTAKQQKPQIITNSWGGDVEYPPSDPPDEVDMAIALEIKDAIEQGILVIFSAGNGHFSIEPQVEGVLSAGGGYIGPDYQLRASDYASGYDSPWFPGVRVPTACGLVGLLPRAQYLMLPVPAGCILDTDESQPDLTVKADGDGTTGSDGWALFSGTSAAAPQMAGITALILSALPDLKPAQVIEAVTKTCLDITRGTCHPRFGNSAAFGNDPATGPGLANAAAAIYYAVTQFGNR